MTTVLLVDDEANLVELLQGYLEREGFDVLGSADGVVVPDDALRSRARAAIAAPPGVSRSASGAGGAGGGGNESGGSNIER